MRISPPGKPNSRGFTFIELAVVLFVLGLVLWLVVPRVATVVGPDRNTVFRKIAAGSEAAFDTALFEKQEVRLTIDPASGICRFGLPGKDAGAPSAADLPEGLHITGVRIENEDQPPDVVTTIRYLPGGKIPAFRIFFHEDGEGTDARDWTLRVNPFDGSVDILEGEVRSDQ